MRRKMNIVLLFLMLVTSAPGTVFAASDTQKVEAELQQLIEQIRYQEEQRNLDEAVRLAGELINRTIDHFGNVDNRTKDALWVMAGIYERAGMWPHYLSVIKRLHSMAQSLYGNAGPRDELARYSYILGQAYVRAGNYADAVPQYQQALATNQNSENYRDQCRYMTALAETYERLENWDDAERAYQKAATTAEKLKDETFPYALDSIYRLYEKLYNRSGRMHPQAESLNKRRIDAWSRLKDREVSVGAAYEDLGDVYFARARYGDAETAYRKAAAISQKRYGRDNKVATVPLSKLAQALAMQQRLEEADALYLHTISVWEKEDIPPSASITSRWHRYLELLSAAGETERAIQLQGRIDALSDRRVSSENRR